MLVPLKARAYIVILALGVLVVLGIVIEISVSKQTRTPTRVLLVSVTGERIPSLFAGIAPIQAYVDGRMYQKNRNLSTCGKKTNFLDRVGTALGLERIAKAQVSCDQSTCNGCYTKIVGRFSSGACEGSYWQDMSGGACNQGFMLSG